MSAPISDALRRLHLLCIESQIYACGLPFAHPTALARVSELVGTARALATVPWLPEHDRALARSVAEVFTRNAAWSSDKEREQFLCGLDMVEHSSRARMQVATMLELKEGKR